LKKIKYPVVPTWVFSDVPVVEVKWRLVCPFKVFISTFVVVEANPEIIHCPGFLTGWPHGWPTGAIFARATMMSVMGSPCLGDDEIVFQRTMNRDQICSRKFFVDADLLCASQVSLFERFIGRNGEIITISV
jgi:hypothetical protein